MLLKKWTRLAVAGWLVVTLADPGSHRAQAAPAAAAPAAAAPNHGVVVRRVAMKDALSAEQFKAKLDALQTGGLFREPPAPPPTPPRPTGTDISFLVSGNYLLVIGNKDWVDSNIDSIRLMAFLFERPRAHLQMNLRVVQLTGPANADVIQMSETVRALVDARRDEIVRTFADLDDYLIRRVRQRQGAERAVYETVTDLFPNLGSGDRPLTVPETLLLLMLDHSSPAPHALVSSDNDMASEIEAAYLELPRVLAAAMDDPHRDDTRTAKEITEELTAWKKAVTAGRDWCTRYLDDLKKSKDKDSIAALKEALHQRDVPLPSWMVRRLRRSLALTERLYPNLARRHTEESLRELQRRYTAALEREAVIEQAIALGDTPSPEQQAKDAEKKKKDEKPTGRIADGRLGRNLIALKSLAEELIPTPLALFEAISTSAGTGAPTPQQLMVMFREYSLERRKLDTHLGADEGNSPKDVNYARLQALEAGLNLWLRRVSEAMARALEQQFYRRYVDEIRLLANKQLGKTSNRDILGEVSIDQVPDTTRDLLLADSGVNIFVSNSISLQFAPDTTNSVSAQVQSSLPSKQSLAERIAQASTATSQLSAMNQAFGINGESMVKALLAGGQSVPVQGGMSLTASPSIGFDASTVTLTLTANETLGTGVDKVADRVTNHSINNATITALSYEPMVLSTLASNVSYFEDSGGIPVLRKAPYLKDLLKDVPIAPFKQSKRQKGVYQSSVIILEPVVIPTIEDLVRFHAGWREGAAATTAGSQDDDITAAALAAAGIAPGKPDAKSEAKPETKPDVKPEVKPEAKPDAKPAAKVETKPEVKPEVKPAAKPEVKPETKSAK